MIDNLRIARMIAVTLGVFGFMIAALVVFASPDAPAGHPSGPVLQLPFCTSEDGSADKVKPCMWHGESSPDGGLTLINFPDGSWCYPTEITRGVWTRCVPEK